MLTVIAACLALGLAQEYREGAAGGAGSQGEGRYRLLVVPIARMLYRIDSETGKTSKALFPDTKIWTPVAESPAELLDAAVAGPPASPAPGAPAPEQPAAPEGVDTP